MSGLLPEQAKGEAPFLSPESVTGPGVENSTPLGIYVHVPFCASTCDFCAFYQKTPTATDVERFLANIEAEAALVTWPRRVSTIFLGGGTPGLLAPRRETLPP